MDMIVQRRRIGRLNRHRYQEWQGCVLVKRRRNWVTKPIQPKFAIPTRSVIRFSHKTIGIPFENLKYGRRETRRGRIRLDLLAIAHEGR